MCALHHALGSGSSRKSMAKVKPRPGKSFFALTSQRVLYEPLMLQDVLSRQSIPRHVAQHFSQQIAQSLDVFFIKLRLSLAAEVSFTEPP